MLNTMSSAFEAAFAALRVVNSLVLFVAHPLRCHSDLMPFLLPGSRMPRTASTVSVRIRRRLVLTSVPAALGLLCVASAAFGHDFWIIPDMFVIEGDAMVHVQALSGTRFPSGSAVQADRIANARLVGVDGETTIRDMAVEGTALRLHQKPASAGQYLVAVAMTPRTTRSTPAGLIRFLRAEGGAGEAARLERDQAFTQGDSLTYASTSYAVTAVQVGKGGPRAFSLSTGFPLQFVPLTDPAHLHVGDTLQVRVLGGGRAEAGIVIDATGSLNNSATPAAALISFVAGSDGVVQVPLTKSGPWMLRSAYVARRAGASSSEWDVARGTYVFNVSAHH